MPRLAIEWKATDGRACGFYHPDEERLVVSFDRPGQFASFADGDEVSFDLDKDGHLLGITVDAPRERWEVEPDLLSPRIGIPATVRFLDFPIQLGSVRLVTEPDYTFLRLVLSPLKAVHVLEPCAGLLLEVGEGGELLAVWILEIQEDYGSRRERAWRTSRTS
jgi:hypothetical protein